jgi:hypothetical protein
MSHPSGAFGRRAQHRFSTESFSVTGACPFNTVLHGSPHFCPYLVLAKSAILHQNCRNRSARTLTSSILRNTALVEGAAAARIAPSYASARPVFPCRTTAAVAAPLSTTRAEEEEEEEEEDDEAAFCAEAFAR